MNHRISFTLSSSLCAALILNNFGLSQQLAGLRKTEVLVVGTVHQRHSTDTNYTYFDIFNILSSYNPDVVCVEIRPQEFRKKPYLTEMTMATIWGIVHDKKVYPIDWWQSDAREVRDSLMKLSEYKQKEQEVEALEQKDSIVTDFERRYGTWKDQGQMGCEFWNGKEYNEYTAEDYRLSMQFFGDSPINLFYVTRNDSMMALIRSAIYENRGRRIIVLTGAEHKHYFDRALAHNPDVALVEFSSILPLTRTEADPAIRAYLDESNDLPYYEKGYPEDVNDYYRTKLIPLIHGPDMDFNPDIVPAKNIQIAEKVIGRWKRDPIPSSASEIIDFELGWLHFLKGDYRMAIGYLLPVSQRIRADTVSDAFLRAAADRNLGLAYDCIEQRDSAIVSYARGEELARATPFAGAIRFLFKNYKSQPYRRGER